jgi:hypothetical protein
MKAVKVAFAMLALAMFSFSSFDAQAQGRPQQQESTVGQLASGLLTVQVGNVQLQIGDITLQDLILVQDVLQDFEITILERLIIQNVRILENANILTNVLRDANILTDSQVVVGILSDQVVIRELGL